CIALASFFCMILPVFIGITYLNFSAEQAWYCVLVFIATLFLIVVFRYIQGKWQNMLVIEHDSVNPSIIKPINKL
ncbi:MAG: hypothetical protein ABR512_01555, partial [Desulfopila sp.]